MSRFQDHRHALTVAALAAFVVPFLSCKGSGGKKSAPTEEPAAEGPGKSTEAGHKPPSTTPASAEMPPDDPNLSPFEQSLARFRFTGKVPAIAAAVTRSDGLVAAGVVGMRSQDGQQAATLKDQWHLGSNTKSMTATLIALLVEDGKLTWDTTLDKALPAHGERMAPEYRSVTIRQLLGNRGGFTGRTILPGLSLKDMHELPGSPREQRATYVAKALITPPEKPPGKFLYSNTGFTVAGAIVEAITDQSFEDALRARLFQPLGITSAGFGAPGSPGKLDQPKLDQPWGHAHNPLLGLNPVAPGPHADNPACIAPAGRVHMAIEDYARYLAMHLNGARGQKTLLKPATMATLHTPVPGDGQPYALGWLRIQRKGIKGPILTHDGSNTMWYASAWIVPEADVAVAVVVNAGGSAGQKTAQAVAKDLLGKYASPDPETPTATPPAATEVRTR